MSKITLEKINYEEENKIVDLIYKDPTLKETFSNHKNITSRILNSIYSAFIKLENETIGFIMIVENNKTNTNELDIVILEKYTNNGYGTLALKELKNIILLNKIEIEVQVEKSNICAIKSILNNGFILIKEDKLYYYYSLSEKDKFSIKTLNLTK